MRPALDAYPLKDALAALDGAHGGVVIVTMARGQWDHVLAGFYNAHCILVELDAAEVPVRAYRRATTPRPDPGPTAPAGGGTRIRRASEAS